MKKSVIFFLPLFLFLFLACSDDSSDDGDIEVAENTPPQDVPADPVADNIANFQGTGSSANDFLANTNFNALRVEIAFVGGFRPTDVALEEFQSFLQRFTFKENIELVLNELPSPEEEDLTLQEISDLEIENRTVYNDGSTLGIYIYFTDAPSEGDDLDEGLVTLGAVYRNTSMVIYEETIRRLSARSAVLTRADVEKAVLNHEFGHLLGLVNLGSPAVNDHEDEDAANHCNVDPCLMRAQLEFSSVGNSVFSRITSSKIKSACTLNGVGLVRQMEENVANGVVMIPELDAECQLDLETNGGRSNTNS